MTNNIEPTLFSDAEINDILINAPASQINNTIAGVVNGRIKKLKDALSAELSRANTSEKNYARALGQIDGLKHTVEVLAGQKARWQERDLYD